MTTALLEDTKEGEIFILFIIILILIMHILYVDRDRLFYTVCEKTSVSKGNILPSLWAYRSRITLEHLLQLVKNQKQFPLLLEFLNEVKNFVHL